MTARAGDTFSNFPSADKAANKAALRRVLRAKRAAIPGPDRRRAARLACRRLMRLRSLRRAHRVALYIEFGSELGTSPLLRALQDNGCRCFAPSVNHRGAMHFLPIHEQEAWRRDALGLRRPVQSRPARLVRRFDVILVPLLGFDAQGARLGMGGGYYDRYLARPRVGRRPWRVGYAFAAQQVAAIDIESFDVRLDAVVTERRLHRFAVTASSTS